MDKSLNMEKHIQNLCHSAVAQLRKIADVRKYLTQNAAEKLIHVFITSRLDIVTHSFMAYHYLLKNYTMSKTWQLKYELSGGNMNTSPTSYGNFTSFQGSTP